MIKSTSDTSLRKDIIPNEVILDNIKSLISEGYSVTLRVKGNSMLPFIVGGKDSVRLVKGIIFRKGDIVLAEDSPKHFVLHRIISISGDLPYDTVILKGDGVLKKKEYCHVKDLVGLVEIIQRKGKERNPYSLLRRIYYWIWIYLIPLKRVFLALSRRLINREEKD
jgi:hypothetical protein